MTGGPRSADPQTTAAPAVAVTLLTQSHCAFCDHAKAVLARLGGEFPLEVTEVDLGSTEGQDLATRHGVLFAPGLLLGAESFGFGRISERKLRRALAARTARS